MKAGKAGVRVIVDGELFGVFAGRRVPVDRRVPVGRVLRQKPVLPSVPFSLPKYMYTKYCYGALARKNRGR